MKKYIKALIERDTPKSPYLDEQTLRANHPAVRCPSCHWVLCLGTEQFCPTCGQRFLEDTERNWEDERRKLVFELENRRKIQHGNKTR